MLCSCNLGRQPNWFETLKGSLSDVLRDKRHAIGQIEYLVNF